MKRRVLLVMRLLVDRHGGAERLFCDLANLLAADGHEVTVAHYDARDGEVRGLAAGITRINLRSWSRYLPWYVATDALRWVAPGEWLSRNLHFVRRLAGLMRATRPDVAISFLPPANTPTLLAGRFAGVPVIPTNHSVPAQDYAGQDNARWSQNPVDRRLRLWALRSAARVHVLFPSFAAWFPEDVRAKVVAIPNAVSAEFWPPHPVLPRRREIVAAGRLIETKNYGALIEAWATIAARIPDWSVVIHGDGPDRAALQARIDELGLGGRCRLAGRTHTEDMRRVYLEAELMAHPSRFEGFGLAVAEAIVCGTPVVAYADCTGVNELVQDGVNGLLVDRAGGAAALAAGLERLIRDQPLRAAMRARGPASMQAYRPEAYAAAWARVIDDVVQ